ncbi:MAG: hypothetical protein HQ582_25530 [Planctomycetes bacterium]|nr:hypothetical protein [Planctomycetota bacterium]
MQAHYDFGILTALEHEGAAASLIFDATPVHHAGRPYEECAIEVGTEATRGVLGLASRMRATSMGLAAQAMIHEFDLDCVILTGIAAGVPSPTRWRDHVRLGDVVVADSVLKFDEVRIKDGNYEHSGDVPTPDTRLLVNARELIKQFLARQQFPWMSHVDRVIAANPMFQRPDDNEDAFFRLDGSGKKGKHPDQRQRIPGSFLPHRGRIGTSAALLKDAGLRNELAGRHGLKAIEMESGGIADAASELDVQFFVVQGICDYGDRDKKDIWQEYAALTSAAFLRATLESWLRTRKPTIKPTATAVAVSVQWSSARNPFRSIEQIRYGNGENFAPSKDEYDRGLVHRPAIADSIEGELRVAGCAMVRGRGAAGKTVLATAMARTLRHKGWESYYLDLAELDTDVYTVREAIVALANERYMFILDNVHLEENVAREVYLQWQDAPNGSTFLMLGRETSRPATPDALDPPLGDLPIKSFTLEASASDLDGIYRRLASRHDTKSPTPPADVLDDWTRLFRGDLIVFGAAVSRRISHLVSGDWRLRKTDASEFVRNRYFTNREPKEVEALLVVATHSSLELSTPSSSVETSALTTYMKHGVVHRIEMGGNRHVHFQLVHAGLGELLVAAKSDYEEIQAFRKIAARDGLGGRRIFNRLFLNGRERDATEVGNSLVSTTHGLQQTLSGGLVGTGPFLERLFSSGVLSLEDAEHMLPDGEALSSMMSSALRTPLDHLGSFLSYAETKLPETHAAVIAATAAAFRTPENAAALETKVLCTPLNHVGLLLRYTETKFPDTHATIAAILAKPDNAVRIELLAAKMKQPGKLLTFIGHVEQFVAPDIGQTLARNVIRGSVVSWQWLGIVHLSHTLRLGSTGDVGETREFLDRAISDQWLRKQSQQCPTGPLAAALFAIWCYQPEEVVDIFRLPTMGERLQQELNRFVVATDDDVFQTVQLLGVLSLVNIKPNQLDAGLLAPRQAAILQVCESFDESKSHIHVQFSLGLREFARVSQAPIMITRNEGDRIRAIVSQWQTENTRQKELSEALDRWLEESASANWVLAR